MKEWFARNEEAIAKWMYRVTITVFAVVSVCDIAGGNASGALGWACACLWCFTCYSLRDLVEKQDEVLTRIFDKCRRNGEK